MMSRLVIHIGLIVACIAAPLTTSAQPVYSVLDTTLDGRALYRQAVEECSAVRLIEAQQKLGDCYDTLVADENLGRAFEPFLGKTAYLTGWTYFRRYEMDPRTTLLDSAAIWFARVVRAEDSVLGPAAAYMRGECGWRWVQAEAWKALCASPGLLSDDEVQGLLDHAEVTSSRFDSCLMLAAEPSLLSDAAKLRKADLDYISARLLRAAHRDSLAVRRIDSLVRPALEGTLSDLSDQGTQLLPILEYAQGWCDLVSALWPVEEPGRIVDLQVWAGFPGPRQELRRGIALQVDGDYISAANSFARAAESDILEGYYWGATAYLIAATSRQSLDQARLTTLDALRRSRESYQAFREAELEEADSRLLQLASQSRRRLLLLQVAMGETVDFDRMRALGREDLRFLIRVIVNTLEPHRSRALRNLSGFLQELLQNPVREEASIVNEQECQVGSAEPLDADETQFFLGLTQALYAQGTFGDQRAEAFRQAAATLAEVGGQYATEAMYIRARALFSGREFAEAEPLLERLVAEHRSTRSAYWYAANFARGRDLTPADSQHVMRVLRAVVNTIEEAGVPSEYTSTHRNAQALIERFDIDSDIQPSRDLAGLESLVCPESLSVDSVGPWPQRVFYETLYERDLIERQFAQLGREELSVFGPQPRAVFPAEVVCGDENRYFVLSPAPAPDRIDVDDKWTARVQFASHVARGLTGPVDSCFARNTTTGEAMICRWDEQDSRYYLQPKATVYDIVEVTVFDNAHFPHRFTMTYDRAGGFKDTIVALAERVVYTRSASRSISDTATVWADSHKRKAVLLRERELPTSVTDALGDNPALRDVAHDPRTGRWLGVSVESPEELSIVGRSSEALTLSVDPPLRSPEGIAVSPDGSILVADWRGHTVVVTDGAGREIDRLGSLGRFADSELFGEGHLVYPAAVEIITDDQGIAIEGNRYWSPTHVLVTDRYGIHRFDSQGRFIETALVADPSELGAWNDLSVSGYGLGSRLQVIDLPGNSVVEFETER